MVSTKQEECTCSVGAYFFDGDHAGAHNAKPNLSLVIGMRIGGALEKGAMLFFELLAKSSLVTSD